MANSIKKCKGCKYYTGIQCHGHGDYWGECKKNKNTLFCYDDTPCLQDVKTLRQLYYEQRDMLMKQQYDIKVNENYEIRYQIQTRRVEKYKLWYEARMQLRISCSLNRCLK